MKSFCSGIFWLCDRLGSFVPMLIFLLYCLGMFFPTTIFVNSDRSSRIASGAKLGFASV